MSEDQDSALGILVNSPSPPDGLAPSRNWKGVAWCDGCGTLHHAVFRGTCPGCHKPSPPPAGRDLVEALYRAYAGPLLRFVRRHAASRGLSESLVDAEGVVHETFTAMLGARGTIQNPPAWLFTVARRLVGKIAGQRHRLAEGDPDELLQSGAAGWTSLVLQASAEDIYEARRALDGMAGLSHHQKAAVYLRTVQGFTHAEIGDYLQCATATAGVHVHRGTTRLHQWLNGLARMITVAAAISAAFKALTLPYAMCTPCDPSCVTGSGQRLPGYENCPGPLELPMSLEVVGLVVLVVLGAISVWWMVRAGREQFAEARDRARWEDYKETVARERWDTSTTPAEGKPR